MNCTLRRPQAIDFAALASWISDAGACIRWAGPRFSFPFADADLPRLLAAIGEESFCLAEGPAVACAFGQYWVNSPGNVHLGRIIVSPVLRGQGLGRLLCQLLMANAVQGTGARAITLRVYRDNPAAIALYLSLGFAVVSSESTATVLFMQAQADSPRLIASDDR